MKKTLCFLALAGLTSILAGCPDEEVDLGEDGGSAAGQGGSGGSVTTTDAGKAGSSGQVNTAGSGPTAGSGGGTGPLCPQGSADCDGLAANGCEADIMSSPMACGGCGKVCVEGSACVNGACRGEVDAGPGECSNNTECKSGWTCVDHECVPYETLDCKEGIADCDWERNNGCETDIWNDPASCGGCGIACAAGQSCSGGVCGFEEDAGDGGDSGPCDPGFADCNGMALDGCETNIFVDSANCGACGHACGGWNPCFNGECAYQDAGVCGDGTCNEVEDCWSCPIDCTECGADAGTCGDGVCNPQEDCYSCPSDCNECPEDAGPDQDAGEACDVFTGGGCLSGFACIMTVPYSNPVDIFCSPAGSTPADAPCGPSALCAPGSRCMIEDLSGAGHCRSFCDLAGGSHGCPTTHRCADAYHPTIGICVPK